EDALIHLYGPVTNTGRPVSVYIATSTRYKGGSADASFALYWGDNHHSNSAYGFEGTQTDARSVLFAILKAVVMAPRNQSLLIYTSSEYAIRSFCYWAADNDMLGWPCKHGDVLEKATLMIRGRSAPVEF
ncbi:hypothetical protein C8R43DRAFT_834954, partial [Mycena crocata]